MAPRIREGCNVPLRIIVDVFRRRLFDNRMIANCTMVCRTSVFVSFGRHERIFLKMSSDMVKEGIDWRQAVCHLAFVTRIICNSGSLIGPCLAEATRVMSNVLRIRRSGIDDRADQRRGRLIAIMQLKKVFFSRISRNIRPRWTDRAAPSSPVQLALVFDPGMLGFKEAVFRAIRDGADISLEVGEDVLAVNSKYKNHRYLQQHLPPVALFPKQDLVMTIRTQKGSADFCYVTQLWHAGAVLRLFVTCCSCLYRPLGRGFCLLYIIQLK